MHTGHTGLICDYRAGKVESCFIVPSSNRSRTTALQAVNPGSSPGGMTIEVAVSLTNNRPAGAITCPMSRGLQCMVLIMRRYNGYRETLPRGVPIYGAVAQWERNSLARKRLWVQVPSVPPAPQMIE